MSTEEIGHRVPVDAEEAYGLGFLVGYMGEVGELALAFSDHNWDLAETPPFLKHALVTHYRRGYDTGTAFAMDHIYPEDRR